ncbi:MAG: 50S ribosomal protein L24 [Rhodobacteraceae bacterium]|jgi:large subunit ribosomal protein L24|nr:50S ribosomal protein L24 [Paracoccaceae bacterium]
MAAKLKKGDNVIILAGKDKGKEGSINSINPSTGKAVVSGVNVSIRHTAQTQNSQGGRVPTEMPIQLSNLALIDPKDGGPTRVGFKMDGDKKVRFAKKSGEVIDG